MTRLLNRAIVADYVAGQLKHGRALSKALLRTWDFSRGSMWTTVHADLARHGGLDFVQGGKLAAVVKQGLEEPKSILERFIAEYLSSEASALVVENEMLRKGELSVERLPGRTGYQGDIPFSFLTSEDANRNTVHDMLMKTRTPFLNVMALLSPAFASEIPEHGAELSEEFFDRVAGSATTLIVGAYDQEAHVVWRKE